MTFCAGGIVPLSTQKPGGKPLDAGGGVGAGGVGAGGVGAGGVGGGGVGAGGVGAGGVGAGGVGAGGVGAGGVGEGDVAGGVVVDTVDAGTPPDPHPNKKNPGMSKEEVATLAKMFISIPVVSGVNAENAIHTG
jgi:hypothetical protein